MTSRERFLMSDGITKMSWGPWGDSSGWGQDTGKGIAARIAGGFIPGVDTVLYGGDAANDFSHGRVGSGLMNTALAGAGLFGFGGIGKLGLLGMKGLGRTMATGAKALRKGSQLGSMSGVAAKSLDFGARNIKSFNKGVGNFGKNTMIGRGFSWTAQHPFKAMPLFMGGSMMGGKLDDTLGTSQASRMAEEGASNTMGALQRIRQNPVFENPIWGNSGGATAGESGMEMGGRLLGPALSYFTGNN